MKKVLLSILAFMFFTLSANAAGVGVAPVALCAHLRKTDHDKIFVAIMAAFVGVAATGQQSAQGTAEQQAKNQGQPFFH